MLCLDVGIDPVGGGVRIAMDDSIQNDLPLFGIAVRSVVFRH